MRRKRIVAYLPPEEFERLEQAAARARTTITPYTQRALRQHLEQTTDAQNDDIRDLLEAAKIEMRGLVEQMTAKFERRNGERVAVLIAMLDQLAYTLFCHLPEAPAHREDAMREAGTRRYRAWKRLVQEIVAESGLEPNMEAEEDAENANHG